MSRFFTFTTKTASLIIVNLLFLFTSLPLITIGLSFCGLYHTSIHLAENTDSYICRSYFSVWRRCLKSGGAVGIILLLLSLCSFANLLIIPRMSLSSIRIYLFCFQLLFLFLVCGFGLYYFPLTGFLEWEMKNAAKAALFLLFKYLPYTVLCIVIALLPFSLCILFPRSIGILISAGILIGFSGIAYIQSLLLLRIFKKSGIYKQNH